MAYLLILPLCFLFAFAMGTITSMITNREDYKYYNATYLAIKNNEYVLCRDSGSIETYRRPSNHNGLDGDEILFFIKNNKIESIKLIGGGRNYIHDRGGVDLYARYWFKKIMDVRSENCTLFTPPSTIDRSRFYYTNMTIQNSLSNTIKKHTFKFLRG